MQTTSEYQARSTRFPWAWIRAREFTAVRSRLGNVAGLDVLGLGAGAGFYTREMMIHAMLKQPGTAEGRVSMLGMDIRDD